MVGGMRGQVNESDGVGRDSKGLLLINQLHSQSPHDAMYIRLLFAKNVLLFSRSWPGVPDPRTRCSAERIWHSCSNAFR